MLARLVVALFLGAILGIERELVGKEAGVKTEIIVSAGAAMFAMIGLSLPYVVAQMSGGAVDVLSQTNAFGVIANIGVGVGFLGAGLIIKQGEHPRGLTTAALIWLTAAIGALAGIGLIAFATITTLLVAFVLYFLRTLDISDHLEHEHEKIIKRGGK